MFATLAAILPMAVVPPGSGTGSSTGGRSYVPTTYCPGCYGQRMPMIGPVLGLLFFLALVAAVIVFIVLFVRKNSAYLQLQSRLQDQAASPVHQAHLILAERLARGEIEVIEYRRRMDALRGGAGFAPPSGPPAT